MLIFWAQNHSIDINGLLKQLRGEKMGIVIVLIILAAVIASGILWGKNTIQKDTLRKIQDEEQLDKLHQLRK